MRIEINCSKTPQRRVSALGFGVCCKNALGKLQKFPLFIGFASELDRESSGRTYKLMISPEKLSAIVSCVDLPGILAIASGNHGHPGWLADK